MAPECQKRVQLVQAAYDLTLERSEPQRTARSIDRFLRLLSDSVVYVPEGAEAADCRGRIAVKRLLARATEQWYSVRYEVAEIRELEGGDLLACGKVLARPDEGRDLIETPFATRWTLRAGRAVRIASFPDRHKALEALNSSKAPTGPAPPQSGSSGMASPGSRPTSTARVRASVPKRSRTSSRAASRAPGGRRPNGSESWTA